MPTDPKQRLAALICQTTLVSDIIDTGLVTLMIDNVIITADEIVERIEVFTDQIKPAPDGSEAAKARLLEWATTIRQCASDPVTGWTPEVIEGGREQDPT